MKIQTLGIALLTLFVVSSLEAVWAEENIDYDADELDVADDELDTFNDEFYEIESVRKHTLCRKKSHHHIKGRCLKSVCRHLCKEDGYKKGKCSKHDSDTIKTCYCYKRCDEPAHPPRSPADAPESTPSDSSSSSTTDAPVDAPSAEIPSNNSPADAPVVAPSAEIPSSSPVVAPSAETPSNSPADAPIAAASPAHSPSTTAFEAFAYEEADILDF
ncbi:hypothetical protein QQ045_000880 [Rhodiola kirilowii]